MFFTKPPVWRLCAWLAVGLLLLLSVRLLARARRPPELPAAIAADGVRKLHEVLDHVRNSDFGRSARGAILTAAATELIASGVVRFSPNLEQEGLYRKELGRRPRIYISVPVHRDRVFWPRSEELAERVYHEALHGVNRSRHRSREEECDAFCAAEEAAAAVGKRPPKYPVMRDGQTIWAWVQEAYSDDPSDPAYVPVGCTPEQLAARTGMAR